LRRMSSAKRNSPSPEGASTTDMRAAQAGGEVRISGVADFDPVHIFECGQCFRWNMREDGSYVGVAMGRAARVRTESGDVFISGTLRDYEDIWRGYFDMDCDYAAIRRRVAVDDYMKRASDFGAGIRILRQDRWEALCSFIISQCNNIPRIKGIVERLCALCGDVTEFMGETFYTFPDAETVASLSEKELASLRCGYRAPYISAAAQAVRDGALDLDALALTDCETARSALKKLPGVGDKVANCVVLFGLHMVDAFPIDTWMKKTISEHYPDGFSPSVFSPYAGVAQQYMFYFARSGGDEPCGCGEDGAKAV